MTIDSSRGRFFLIALAGISLLTGLWAGLARMGWLLPLSNEQLVLVHGPLMVVGFLGVLIGLERAVALQRWWAYAIPVCAGLSSLFALSGAPLQLSAALAVLAGMLLVVVFITLYRQYPSEHFIIMALSALAWTVGSVLWFAETVVFALIPWWVGYLVLMIAGERLELSRLRQPPVSVRRAFHVCVGVILTGLACSFFDVPNSIRICGLGFFALALWLLRYDLAWKSAKQAGLPRFMAISLIAGYAWLAIGGILWMGFARYFSAGPRYDAMLHSIFLGFVFSMIFAHAPIILPTITGLALPFRKDFYLHAGLLHLSLIGRIAADIFLLLPLQRWAGLLNAAAIALFLVNNIRAVRLGAKARSFKKSGAR
jgi:hypothetical protein